MWVERHGKAWRIRERLAGELRTVQGGFPTKTAASAARKLLEADHLRGDLVLPADGRILLGEWLEEWWAARIDGLSPSTRKSEGGRIRNLLVPRLGGVEVGALTPMAVQLWVRDLAAAGYAAKTVHNAHGILHTAMAAAVAERLRKGNPCAGTKLPRGEHREMRFLTEQEADRLLVALPEHYRPLVLAALGTGLRWAELAGLRVRRVDLFAKHVRVEETLQETAGTGELVWGPPKTKASRRTVPIHASVRDALLPLVANRARDAVVFTTVQGHELRVRNFRRVWLAALERAGLEPDRPAGVRRSEGVRFHDLRHTHAAWLISAGRPLTAVQRRLGHTSITVTSDRYGHLLPEVDEGILDVLDAALPASSWGPDPASNRPIRSANPDPGGEQTGSSGPRKARSNTDEAGGTSTSRPVRVA